MPKLVKISESDLVKIIKKIIKEQDEKSSIDKDSYEICNHNVKGGSNTSTWWNTEWTKKTKQEKESIINNITNQINSGINKSVREYISWFNLPETLNKFKPNEIKVAKSLPSYLNQINKIKFHLKGPDKVPNAIAWVNYKINPYLINFNLSKLFEGTSSVFDVYETIKHEIGHLIDSYLVKNGVKTYLNTVDETGNNYITNYLINDRDQYTRLNFFRGLVGAGPQDSGKELLNKFLSKVNQGIVTSDIYTFKPAKMSTNYPKNNIADANAVYKKLQGHIMYDGKTSINLEQLFSNFGKLTNNNMIVVNFNEIANLNVTSKALEFDYLVILPKENTSQQNQTPTNQPTQNINQQTNTRPRPRRNIEDY